MKRWEISMCEFFLSYSEALDFIAPEIVQHHYDVAYISAEILKTLKISPRERQTILLAALVHDIGIFTLRERTESIQFEFEQEDRHALFGALLLEKYAKFPEIPLIIRDHHLRWQDASGRPVHPGSPVIYLADRIAVLVNKDRPILTQRRQIMEQIRSERGKKFAPQLVDAFLELAGIESFCLNLTTSAKDRVICDSLSFEKTLLGIEEILEFGRIFINAIDLRSRYTAAHSLTVAAMAERIGLLAGFHAEEAGLLKLGGYFHDIGKVAVPAEITNKAGALTFEEAEIVKCHPFYTRSILKNINGFETVTEVASCHHEHLDGGGYPFHLTAQELSVEANLLHVADVLTALTEDRPYRSALPKHSILKILRDMEISKQIVKDFTPIIIRHYKDLEDLSKELQQTSYRDFLEMELALKKVDGEVGR